MSQNTEFYEAAQKLLSCANGPHDLSIEHLHLSEKTNSAIHEFGVRRISHLARDFAKQGEIYEFLKRSDKSWDIITRNIIKLADTIKNGKFDWLQYWKSINYQFVSLAMKLDDSSQLNEVDLEFDIRFLNLGKSEFLIRKIGISTCAELVMALSGDFTTPIGFGKLKIMQLTNAMIKFINKPSLPSDSKSNTEYFPTPRQQLASTTESLKLCEIRLHTQISKLNSIGIISVGDLIEALPKGLPHIRGLGKKSKDKILSSAQALSESLDEKGEVDWNKFATVCEYTVIPAPHIEIPDGATFVSQLSHVTNTLAHNCFDKVESATLQERLSKHKSITLDALGKQYGMTRERIRQKQMNLLNSISSALLDGDYSGMNFRFSEQFSSYWKLAARHFGETTSLEFNRFIDGLASAWKVDSSQILPHLPLIYCVLTKDGSLPSSFKTNLKLSEELSNICEADSNRLIESLHPNKSLHRYLASISLNTLSDIIREVYDSSSSIPKRRKEQIIDSILQHITLDKDYGVDWKNYYTKKGIILLPVEDVLSVENFSSIMIETILKFSSFINWANVEEILKFRSIPTPADRKTLEQSAELLGTYGSVIKRIETITLRIINDAIFRDDYVGKNFRLQEGFVSIFKEATNIIQDTHKVDDATKLLSKAWNFDSSKITPLLLSIITGYPLGYPGKVRYKRPARLKRQIINPNTHIGFGKITLRGFKTVC